MSIVERLATPLHLTSRLLGAVRPGALPMQDQGWVEALLLPGELKVWQQMNNPDKRHAVGVAKAVKFELDDEATREVLAAALLHDSGKILSGLRTPARVIATVFWMVVPSSYAHRWKDGKWLAGRFARYRLHPQLGAAMLTEAGSGQLTISWAAEHHQPAEAWTVPRDIGRILKDCDDDRNPR